MKYKVGDYIYHIPSGQVCRIDAMKKPYDIAIKLPPCNFRPGGSKRWGTGEKFIRPATDVEILKFRLQ